MRKSIAVDSILFPCKATAWLFKYRPAKRAAQLFVLRVQPFPLKNTLLVIYNWAGRRAVLWFSFPLSFASFNQMQRGKIGIFEK